MLSDGEVKQVSMVFMFLDTWVGGMCSQTVMVALSDSVETPVYNSAGSPRNHVDKPLREHDILKPSPV